MIKENKGKVILSFLAVILPALIVYILKRGLAGSETDWSLLSYISGVSWILILVILIGFIPAQGLMLLLFSMDPNNEKQSEEVKSLMLWTIPFSSFIFTLCMITSSSGAMGAVKGIFSVGMGLMMIIIGSYMPKIKRNQVMGIRLPWTLANEENWNAVHKLAGKIWMVSGFITLILAPLPFTNIMTNSVIVLVLLIGAGSIVPAVYSYIYARRQKREGCYRVEPIDRMSRRIKRNLRIGLAVFLTVLAVSIALLMSTGDIEVKYGEDSFKLEASYWSSTKVYYSSIDSIEYQDDCPVGLRTMGLSSSKLLAGSFNSSEFGDYTRYSYTKCKSAVVIESGSKTIVVSGKDDKETKAIYNTLKRKVAESKER